MRLFDLEKSHINYNYDIADIYLNDFSNHRIALEHFEKVLSLIKSRGRYLEPLKAPPYGGLLAKEIRKIEKEGRFDNLNGGNNAKDPETLY